MVDHRLRIAHLTTVDMSLMLLLGTELSVDVEAGHEVFGLSASGPYVDQIQALGVTHVAVPFTRRWNPRSDVRAARELWATLRSLRLDVLHTHTPKAGVVGRILGRLAGVPVVVNTCHGLWSTPDDGRARRTLVIGVEGLASWFSDAELFQNAADRWAMRWFVRDRRTRVVGNGVDLGRFAFDASERRRVRSEWGVRDHEVLVGGVGRRVEEKGVREMAAAAQALAGRARFIWVGPVDDTKRDAVRSPLPGLEMKDERADMPAVYSALDVFVLPSYREGFSRSAMEAAACERAMILTDVRGCREIGTHGEHLLLVPPRDSAALTESLAALIDDPAARERLGAAASKRARGAFDQRAVARASLETYAAVAHRKGLAWG